MTEPPEPIEWPCMVCREPIEDKEGYLCIDPSRAALTGRSQWKWDDAHRTPTEEELAQRPADAQWSVIHGDCDPRPDAADDWWVPVEELRTFVNVAWATRRLLQTSWGAHTNWDQVLGLSLEQR